MRPIHVKHPLEYRVVRPHDKPSSLEIWPEQEERPGNCETFALGRQVVPFSWCQDPAPVAHRLICPIWLLVEKNASILAGACVRIHGVLAIPPRERQDRSTGQPVLQLLEGLRLLLVDGWSRVRHVSTCHCQKLSGPLRVVFDKSPVSVAHSQKAPKVLLGLGRLGLTETHQVLLVHPELARANDVAQIFDLIMDQETLASLERHIRLK